MWQMAVYLHNFDIGIELYKTIELTGGIWRRLLLLFFWVKFIIKERKMKNAQSDIRKARKIDGELYRSGSRGF